ncbi:MAG: site-specific integrase [Bacteroidota bacterium]|nr:site-specific integrase [Bacteroidota bacterium]
MLGNSKSTKTRQTYALSFFLKKSRTDKKGNLAIYGKITVNGEPKEFATKQFCPREKWNVGKGRIKANDDWSIIANEALENFELRGKEIYNDYLARRKFVSSAVIKSELLGESLNENTFLKFFSEHMQYLALQIRKNRNDEGISPGTYKNYVSTIKHLKTFIQKKYKKEDLFFEELDYTFIEAFDLYLKTTGDNAQNGANKHHQRIKKVAGLAVKKNLITVDPFRDFQLKTKPVNRDFLDESELQLLENENFENQPSKDCLIRAKDLFVFCCYTGMSYSDLAELTIENIVLGIDGKKWISFDRNKTGIPQFVPLLPQSARIIDKYSEHPFSKSKGILLPVYSNQPFNRYLKRIAVILGIGKNLSTHIGRHTFATTVTLENDVPIETVSAMLGHTSIRTTQIYAKVKQKKIKQDMLKVWDKLAKQENNKNEVGKSNVG